MPFHTLMFDSLLQGTSFTENGNTIHVQQKAGETILFFRIDQPFHTATGLRRYVGEDCRMADLLVYFRGAQAGSEIRLCVVELKGRDVASAEQQVLKTKEVFEKAFSDLGLPRGARPKFIWLARIRISGQSPKYTHKTGLEKAFGRYVRIIRDEDLGPQLREK